ncbi:NfeD family protein [Psychromonas aquimarina]|uniref:NfeD family protein n=1 Tax=Psychromonas aquimarina TaxID=444919 RepID=UPI0003FF3D61|nr:nodulation protein NfeD [Psychromonas aquimarina]
MKILPVYLLLLSVFCSFTVSASEVWIIPVNGAVGPASSDYISRELDLANQSRAGLVILKMDTPGGLDSAMRDIIRAITVSSVPVATWVGPSGARAASAGTYILFASHLAVMANATNLGAATPVSIGIQGPKPSPGQEQKDNQAQESDKPASQPEKENKKVSAKSNLEKKVINDATAYIKGLAKLHGRNEQWAEKAVTEAASLDAQEALAENVIDFIADDLKQLVKLADGRRVLIRGVETRLVLGQVDFVERIPDWRFAFLATITNPNVAYILMLIGIYGLLLEFYNPGLGLPGVLGGICLLMGMYALQMLPVNYAGLALILLGIALLAAEAFSPSFGIFGLGGIAAFSLGSVFLMDSEMPAFQIAKPLIAGFSITSVLFTFVIIGMLLRVRRKTVTTGVECMVGQTATVVNDFIQGEGWVEVGGETWQARSSGDLQEGQLAAVQAVSGLWLQVALITEQEIQQIKDK